MRTLTQIKRDLTLVLKRGTEDARLIGKLLTEAKEQVKHGDWYSWLKDNFDLSKSYATWHMRLYEATKSLKISGLKIYPTLLYAMYVERKYDELVMQQLLREARLNFVGPTRAEELQQQHKKKDPARADWLQVFDKIEGSLCDCDEWTAWLDRNNSTIADRDLLAKKSANAINQLNSIVHRLRNFTIIEFAEAAE
jgi:hypothetical protein